MAYFPPPIIATTENPKPGQRDFQLAVRLTEERWRRFFPAILYEKLIVQPTARTSLDSVVGQPGATQFDPLWQEAVSPTLQGNLWAQPHLSGTTDATVDATDVYMPPAQMHARVQKEALDAELKKWGFDRVRDTLLIVPCSMFDAAGITAEAGDRVTLDNDYFNVVQRTLDTFWKNTNLKLFVVLNCEHRRRGS